MNFIRLLSIVIALGSVTVGRAADTGLLVNQAGPGDFVLCGPQTNTTLYVDPKATPSVARAARDLVADIERVSGVRPTLGHEVAKAGQGTVFIGVLGQDSLLDRLAAEGKLAVDGVRGEWESYVIQTVEAPMPGVARALVIAGSDPRGAIYGIYKLSESIGVSPWNWWADVPVKKSASIAIRAGVHKQGPPAVKYRGLFINDEDWGLQPWAAKTFEPETGDIGPKTYAKVFELLLRLRANTCWPAMHPSTHAFNSYPDDKLVADEYGIVMGSSHAEPMLRNNVDEWPHDHPEAYNYVTNRDGVLKYWEDRVRENGRFQNLYTMGMRGVHDSGMPGGGTLDEKAARLSRIISDQRELLKKWVNPDPTKVPQIFCPYKEVLDIYRRMSPPPPDDITLVWPDDNWGYVRQFSNVRERARSGGAGVYYHLSYWGAPYDYLWLCSISPALVWEEMTKAYDYGANAVWIANVGDIKPAEIDLEFFLQLAWNPHRWPAETVQEEFLRAMAARDFGTEHAEEIAAILGEYYRLNFARKPEHMGFDAKKPLLAKPVFSTTANGNEAQRRSDAFAALVKRAEAMNQEIDPVQRDAFFELVLYPVRGAALMNEKGLELTRYRVAFESGAADATAHLERARTAHAAILAETANYNERIAGGKWRRIMSAAPRDQAVFQAPEPLPTPSVAAKAARNDAPPARPTVMPANNVVTVVNDPTVDFTEVDGRVVIEAEHASTRIPGKDAAWKTLNGVGYNGASVLISPTTVATPETPAQIQSDAPRLEYTLALATPGKMKVTVRTLPTWAITAGKPQRYAIALDDEQPQLVSLPTYTDERNLEWQRDVLRNAALSVSTHAATAGRHTLKVWMIDPGIVIDTLMLERAGAPDAGYNWPDETRAPK